ncbi:reverse transcriptase domain-containing protein [Tanacetum coccineum]
MYLRGRRRDVPRIQSQYQRDKGMSGQSRRCFKSSISKMFEGRAKVEWKAGKLEQLIAKLPTLTAPEEKDELIVYMAATNEAPRLKRSGSELHINGKIGFGTGTCQQAYKKILPNTPNYSDHGPTHKASIIKTESCRKAKKWSIELGEYAIHYRPRVSVKGKILADFIIERLEEDSPDTPMEVEEEFSEPWILFTEGSSCADGYGGGLILTNSEGAEFTYDLRFRFETTNNEAEYEALIAGLRIAEEMGVKNLQANVDSRLVANQVNGTYVAKEADMIRYLEKVRTLTNGFRMFSIKQVPRSENKKADALSKITSTSFAHLSKQVLVEELKEKSINELEVLAIVEEEGGYIDDPNLYEYLTEETPLRQRHKICSGQSFANLILLAYYAQGCKGIDKGMPRLPGSPTYPKKSAAKANPNNVPMAIL